MAYVVGLTATDGCLLSGRRAINFKSEDRDLVETYLRLLGRRNQIKSHRTYAGRFAYYTQFHDSRLYEWFRSVGLMPRKSLALGALRVPRELFIDTARGLLDGDGSIVNFRYRGTGKARGREYETIRLYFNSASRPHLLWIQEEMQALLGIRGVVKFISYTSAGNPYYRTEYAMRETTIALRSIYRDPKAPCLQRKRLIWDTYLARVASGLARSAPVIIESSNQPARVAER